MAARVLSRWAGLPAGALAALALLVLLANPALAKYASIVIAAGGAGLTSRRPG